MSEKKDEIKEKEKEKEQDRELMESTMETILPGFRKWFQRASPAQQAKAIADFKRGYDEDIIIRTSAEGAKTIPVIAEKWKEKTDKMKEKYKMGITGEYEPFRELVCPVLTNVAHSERYIFCHGPRCGHWNRRLKMCGTATMGDMAWTHLEYHKDYKATMEFYREKEEHTITTLRNKLDEIYKLAKEGEKHLNNADEVDCMGYVVWAIDNIEEIIKQTEPEEKKEDKEEKTLNTYHFDFSVEIPDTLSEDEQKYISENLLGKLNEHLFDKGFHLPSIRVINKWYEGEWEETEDECDPPIAPFPIKPPTLGTADQFTEASEEIGRSHYGGEEEE